ncbi:MAG: RDD family protein [Bacteroidetes bacterium]|nr:RDD family protein [Bacteroidota bacterium]MBS1974734.1 RDD family protein [Bacteroidota bacterium]
MSLVKLDTGFNIEIDFPITPFHKRLFAWAIDLVVMFAYMWIVQKLLGLLYSGPSLVPTIIAVIAQVPVLFYHLVSEVAMNGQSIGKKAMNIQVIALDGGQPSISQYLIRWMFRSIDFPVIVFAAVVTGQLPWWCMAFLFSGIGCVIITEHSQRVGDLVAGTIIIDKKNRTSWQDTVFTELESSYQPMFPQVMLLSDKDVNTLKSIIGSVKKSRNFDLSMRIAERIKSKLGIHSDLDSLDFLETLLKDYNYYTIA